MSQAENVKADKIKALALAKECYAMKLELLTNATVIDDAIRFVTSNTTKITERDNPDRMVTVNGEVTNYNIKNTGKSYSGQEPRRSTNNCIF
jgi:hypothetical protein